MKSQYRVSRPAVEPTIAKLPHEWATIAPQVRVRRLGLKLELDLRDNLQRTLYYTGTYEPSTLRFLRREIRRGDVFVDIGAHIGVHALTVAHRFRALGAGRVFAFEPAHDTADKLRAGAERNHLEITVVEVALGSAAGKSELFADPNFDPADAGVRSQYGNGELVQSVRMMTFDEWALRERLDRMDLVKIDVEGAEGVVLQGMLQSLRRLRPRALIVEIKQANIARAGSSESELRRLLRDAGYQAAETAGHRNKVFRPL